MSGGKVKKGSGKNRGYIGYHTTWDGNRVFLRSKCEFIYARVLDIEKKYYMLEKCIYTVGDNRYKPDFFLYKNPDYTGLYKIVEIKGLDDKKTALEYLNKYKEYFESIDIKYEVKWKYQALVTKYNLHDDIQQWIESSINNYDSVSDVRGKHNPMYGLKHKSSTIKQIREKALSRQTDEYRKKNSDAQKAFWKTERGLGRKKEISKFRKELSKKQNPIVDKLCKDCGSVYKDKLKFNNEFCSTKCKRKWRYVNIPGYGQHKNRK